MQVRCLVAISDFHHAYLENHTLWLNTIFKFLKNVGKVRKGKEKVSVKANSI